MAIVKNDCVIDNEWVALDDESSVPESGANVLVSLARFKAEHDSLIARNGGLGVLLVPGDAPEDLADDIDRFSLIAVKFPAYTDGRGYSYGRILRERYGYKGEMRAVGDVLRDQILYMHRCGFDAYEMADDGDVALEKVRAALRDMTVYYQPTGDDRATAGSLRERRRAALDGASS
ncbi:DUF934 domain-containing protein [Thalassospira mesophila]|uniref:Oxidoreductase n=1 Tax=Thalassospira mesophila TaxID=1293891 RepID=A0A1Y2KXP2_9PROT|nr:DUF934 domain-containing protein [Thalassospira mesophila]OSQ37150.1 oxidoreductase [Thalassospira mesophila]